MAAGGRACLLQQQQRAARPSPCSSSSSGACSTSSPAISSSPLLVRRGVSRASTVRVNARRGRGDRRRPPPPDLPSLLFDQRIVYLGMPVRSPFFLRPLLARCDRCAPAVAGRLGSNGSPCSRWQGGLRNARCMPRAPRACARAAAATALLLPSHTTTRRPSDHHARNHHISTTTITARARRDRADGRRAALPGEAGVAAPYRDADQLVGHDAAGRRDREPCGLALGA